MGRPFYLSRIAVCIGLLASGPCYASFLTTLWGTTPDNVLYLGMWTVHLRPSNSENSNNWLLGIGYESFIAGTFINSHFRRCYALGIQRNLYHASFSNNWDLAGGYRISAVTGYDKNLMPLAEKTPVVPVGQLVGRLSYKNIGVEISWGGIIVSAGFIIKF